MDRQNLRTRLCVATLVGALLGLAPAVRATEPLTQSDPPRGEVANPEQAPPDGAPSWLAPLEEAFELVHETLLHLFGHDGGPGAPGGGDEDGEQGASIDPNGVRPHPR